jgi:hypothetical protein
MTLTNADIAQKVAGDCGFLKGDAAGIIEKLLRIMNGTLAAGEDVIDVQEIVDKRGILYDTDVVDSCPAIV